MGSQGKAGEVAFADSHCEGGGGNRGHSRVGGGSWGSTIGRSAREEGRNDEELHVERVFASTHCRSEGVVKVRREKLFVLHML